jgi:hypothetical protein
MRKPILKESTGANNSGTVNGPIELSPHIWDEKQLGPFTDRLYKYTNAELAYQEADGDFKDSSEKREKIDSRTKQISKRNMKKKKDALTKDKISSLKEELLKEDLAVWFGTKKKPKGSKQPKGPWVNICRKDKDGKHPPCGRPEFSDKGYPKCRASGVAGKMSDSEKRAACQQKRRAEKTNPKTGTGNKPKMVSYKSKKSKNESLRDIIFKVLKEEVNPQKIVTN